MRCAFEVRMVVVAIGGGEDEQGEEECDSWLSVYSIIISSTAAVHESGNSVLIEMHGMSSIDIVTVAVDVGDEI
jgi:hypothetical protein